MDSVRFNSENNEFIIELSKEKRYFGYSEFGNYICHMKFMDLLGTCVLDINTNEAQLMSLMNILYSDDILLSGLYNIVDFNQDMSMMIMTSEPKDYPSEDDDKIYLQVFQRDPIYGNVSRLYMETTLDFKDNLIYNIYQLLQDIPNFNELRYKDLNDYGINYDFFGLE
jgi:hypothetical protein